MPGLTTLCMFGPQGANSTFRDAMTQVTFFTLVPSTAKLRIRTLRIWGFRGPGFRSARHVFCKDASRLFLAHFPKHLNSVLGRTELCHEVWNPRPQKPQIIRNENHHLALLDSGLVACDSAICGRLATAILWLLPPGLRLGKFRAPFSNGRGRHPGIG